MTDPPDGDLVRSAQGGDRGAFEALVERHKGWVRNLMIARTREWNLAEEAAQEAFMKAFAALGSLKEPDAFRGWLRTLSERVAIDARRQPSPQVELPETAAPGETPRHEAEERRSAVARAVEALEEPYREVVLLRYDRGLSCAEIARELGLTPAAVSMRLVRAHADLAGPLAEWRTP